MPRPQPATRRKIVRAASPDGRRRRIVRPPTIERLERRDLLAVLVFQSGALESKASIGSDSREAFINDVNQDRTEEGKLEVPSRGAFSISALTSRPSSGGSTLELGITQRGGFVTKSLITLSQSAHLNSPLSPGSVAVKIEPSSSTETAGDPVSVQLGLLFNVTGYAAINAEVRAQYAVGYTHNAVSRTLVSNDMLLERGYSDRETASFDAKIGDSFTLYLDDVVTAKSTPDYHFVQTGYWTELKLNLSVAPKGKPDITMEALTLSDDGKSAELSYRTAGDPGPFVVELYYSPTDSFDSATAVPVMDPATGRTLTHTVNAPRPGAPSSREAIPLGTPPIERQDLPYLVAVADPSNTIRETDEGPGNAASRIRPPLVVNVLTHGYNPNPFDWEGFRSDWYAAARTLNGLAIAGAALHDRVASYVSEWDSTSGWNLAASSLLASLVLPTPANLAARKVTQALMVGARRTAAGAARKIFEELTAPGSGYLMSPGFGQVVHLIGHSRGGAVNARVARLLTIAGYTVDQYTSLDGYSTDWPLPSGLLGDLSIVEETARDAIRSKYNYRVQEGLAQVLAQFLIIPPGPNLINRLIGATLDWRAPDRGASGFIDWFITGDPESEQGFSNHLNVSDVYFLPSRPYLYENYLGRNYEKPVGEGDLEVPAAANRGVSLAGSMASTFSTAPDGADNFTDGSFESLGQLWNEVLTTDLPTFDDSFLADWAATIRDPAGLLGSTWIVRGGARLVQFDGNTLAELSLGSGASSIGQYLELGPDPSVLSFDLSVSGAQAGDQLRVLFGDEVLASFDLAGRPPRSTLRVPMSRIASRAGEARLELIGPAGGAVRVQFDNLAVMPDVPATIAGASTYLQAVQNIPTGLVGASQAVASGDFDGDGRADLIGASFGASFEGTYGIALLPGRGDGTFGAPRWFGFLAAYTSLAVGDFNGDGKLDVVAAHALRNTVAVYLGDGLGSFGNPVEYAAGSSVHSVVVADFDGDGRDDVATVGSLSRNVNVLLARDDGSFRVATSYAAGTNPLWLSVGDFNGDRAPDLAVLDPPGGSVQVLLNLGSGTFGAAVRTSAMSDADSLAAGDYDGDGKDDVAVTSNTAGVHVLYGTGDGKFLPPALLAGFPFANRLEFEDLDGDGKEDIVAWVRRTLVVLRSNGRGQAPTRAEYTVYFAPDYANPGQIAGADFDGDGHLDLAVAGGEMRSVGVLLNRGDTTFPAVDVRRVTLGAGFALEGRMTGADFDGDGRDDIAGISVDPNGTRRVEIFRSEADGGFSVRSVDLSFSDGKVPHLLVAADLDRDGRPDLIVDRISDLGSELVVYRQQADGTMVRNDSLISASATMSVAIGDFDGDQFPDIVSAEIPPSKSPDSAHGPHLKIYLNRGDGSFRTATISPFAGDSPKWLAAADFDGDGKTDLALVNQNLSGTFGADTSIFFGLANGTFKAPVHYKGGSNSFVRAMDVNGDRHPDLVMVNRIASSVVNVLLNQGNGTFGSWIESPAGTQVDHFGIADYDGDGTPDLMVPTLHGDALLLGAGDGTFGAPIYYNSGVFTPGAAGDFDGDGRPDYATLGSNLGTAGQNSAWAILRNVYSPPPATLTLDPIVDRSLAEGQPLTLIARATHSLASRKLTFSLDPGAPPGASIEPATGRLTLPATTTPGTYAVTVRVTDDATPPLTATQSFFLTVTNVLPAVTSGAAGSSSVGIAFTRVGSFSDPGSGPWAASVDYGDGAGPRWLGLGPDGTFRLDHVYNAAGTYQVQVIVSDAAGGQGRAGFTVAVAAPPPSYVAFREATAVAQERAGRVAVTVSRTGNTAGTATVRYATEGGTAVAGVDFLPGEGTLLFGPGETLKTIAIDVLDDSVAESPESFRVRLSSPSGATLGGATLASLTLNDPPRRLPNDFNGDGKSDYAVYRLVDNDYRPYGTAKWFTIQNGGPTGAEVYDWARQWGISSDTPVPGDFDGDGRGDYTVFRTGDPFDPDGQGRTDWYIALNRGNGVNVKPMRNTGLRNLWAFPFGQPGDVPIPGDFDGDGKGDLAVYRPGEGKFYVKTLSFTVQAGEYLATLTDLFVGLPIWDPNGQPIAGGQPVSGDYNGDGRIDFAVFQASGNQGAYRIRLNLPDGTQPYTYAAIGQPGDRAVSGDFDADGRTDLVLYRPDVLDIGGGLKVSGWYVWNNLALATSTTIPGFPPAGNNLVPVDYTAAQPGIQPFYHGLSADTPISADVNGDGRSDFMVFRPDERTVFVPDLGYDVTVAAWYTLTNLPGNQPGQWDWGRLHGVRTDNPIGRYPLVAAGGTVGTSAASTIKLAGVPDAQAATTPAAARITVAPAPRRTPARQAVRPASVSALLEPPDPFRVLLRRKARLHRGR